MHITYVIEPTDYWVQFYKSTIKDQSQYQLGGNLAGFKAHAPYHRGAGVGNFFKGLYRIALPLIKSMGKQALITGSKIAADLAEGKEIKESATRHGKIAATMVLRKTANKIQNLQTGDGLGIAMQKTHNKAAKKLEYKRKRSGKQSPFRQKRTRRLVASDIFG